MPFTESMKKFYTANGFLVVERLFQPQELAGVQRLTDAIVADPASAPVGVNIGFERDTLADGSQGSAADAMRGIAGMARFNPEFQRVARDPKLLELVRGLIGERIMVFRDNMLLKPPGGQDKPLHQDNSYFRMHPADAFTTAWIAMDEATEENGCMSYVAGSHRHGTFAVEPDPERPIHHIPRTGEVALGPEVRCPVPPGSVIFHHVNTLHRSAPNRTPTWRRALIFHYAGADARSEVDRFNEEISLRID